MRLQKEIAGTSPHHQDETVFAFYCEWTQNGLGRKTDRNATGGERTQLYQLVTVIQNHIDFESLTVTGSLYEQFQLKKAGGRLVWLISPLARRHAVLKNLPDWHQQAPQNKIPLEGSIR